MRLRETNGDSLDSERIMETNETQRDYWIHMRLRENNGDQWESERLLETHETNGYS